MYDYFKLGESEQYQFLQLPWMLIKDQKFKKLSDSSKILYSLLLNRTSLSAKNGWVDENGNIYIIYTLENIMEDLCCWKEKATKAMKELKEEGLVESKRRGLGKPNLLYVKNFATSLKYTPGTTKNPVDTQKFGNRTSGSSEIELLEGLESEPLEVRKSNPSNTDFSKIYQSDIESESMSKSDGDERIKTDATLTPTPDVQSINLKQNEKELSPTAAVQSPVIESPLPLDETFTSTSVEDKFTTYMRIIQDNIEYTHYADHRPHDIEIVDELVSCMLDVICTEGTTVKVNGEDKSREMVKSQYLKINSMDIDHIIDKFREQRHKITHVHSYLKTMLYTVKQEMSAHYDNAVRADGVV